MRRITMKAAVLTGVKKIELQEKDLTPLRPNEVLVKVKAVGVCGSDIAYYQRGQADVPPPIILGHEFTGEVVELGSMAKDLGSVKVGERVVAEPVQACGVCQPCKNASPNLCVKPTVLGVNVDGGFAEYCKVQYNYIHTLPRNVSYEEGAFTEPLACALYGVGKMRIQPGDFCVVVGPGPIGLMMLQYVKASGAGKVALIGTRDYRLKLGGKLGADYLLNTRERGSKYFAENPVEKVKEWSGGGADAVIVATGNIEANELGIAVAGVKSRVVFFGGAGYGPEEQAKINLWQGTLRDMEIHYSWLSPYTFPKAIKAISQGLVKVKPLITHTFNLNKTGEAIETVEQRKGNPLKVQVKP
jgi:threonine dehydrogenase-like Zn-dependent dehydrogenase